SQSNANRIVSTTVDLHVPRAPMRHVSPSANSIEASLRNPAEVRTERILIGIRLSRRSRLANTSAWAWRVADTRWRGHTPGRVETGERSPGHRHGWNRRVAAALAPRVSPSPEMRPSEAAPNKPNRLPRTHDEVKVYRFLLSRRIDLRSRK